MMSGHGGPGKKGGHEEGGGHAPMWIVSFADMVILLMSFFVLLLCQRPQNTTSDDDLLKIIASVKLNFGYTPRPDSKDQLDAAVLQVLSQRNGKGFLPSAVQWKSPAIKGQLKKDKDNFVKAQSNIGKAIRFAKNSDVIEKKGLEDLDEIATVIRNHYRTVVIQGHCSREEAARDAEGGDDLSYRRALAVKRVLASNGIAPAKLRPIPCSCNELPDVTKPADRQLAVVTIGAYMLPGQSDVLNDDSIVPPIEKQASNHGH